MEGVVQMKKQIPMLLLVLVVAFIVAPSALASSDYDPMKVSGWPHKNGFDWIKMDTYEKSLYLNGFLSGMHFVQDWTVLESVETKEETQDGQNIQVFVRSLKEKAQLPLEEQAEAFPTLWQAYPLFAVFNFKVGDYSDRLDAYYREYDKLKTYIPLALMIVNADLLQERGY